MPTPVSLQQNMGGLQQHSSNGMDQQWFGYNNKSPSLPPEAARPLGMATLLPLPHYPYPGHDEYYSRFLFPIISSN